MAKQRSVRRERQARLWVPPELPGLELQQASHGRASFAAHAHDTLALVAFDEGAEVLKLRGNSVTGAAGSLLVVNPGEMHAGRTHEACEGWSYRIFYVAEARLRDAAREAGLSWDTVPGFARPQLEDLVLRRRFDAAFAAVTRPGASALEREERVLALLVRLVGRATRPPTRCHPGVRRAREWLEANAARNVGLRELADVAGLSPWHLVRAFGDQLGQTPQMYQRTLRLRRAQTLLATGQPMAQVALEAGFSDQSHLVKQFTRTLGATPGEYRAGLG